jgi:uncharacterized protein YbjT (DUF2867 family)
MVMRIAIVGGTGTLGRQVVAELARRGHEARALSRSGEYPVDLTTGAGLAGALDGCTVVVDASNAQRNAASVLVEGSARLLDAASAAGVSHHVCVSIVGCDQVPMGYYKVKTAQEQVVEQGPVPWSIVRATQFHELAATALAAAARFRVIPAPGMKLQTIAAADVALAVADVAEGEARGRVQAGGPEIMTVADLARTWRDATGRRAVLVPLPLPGKTGHALKAGRLTVTDPDFKGTQTFRAWLAAHDQHR